VIRKNETLYAYRNRCPHTGVNLNWLPDQFLDLNGEYIQCAMHGALFRIDDGYCVYGPCAGASLEKLPLQCEQGKVYLITENAFLSKETKPGEPL
jgi:nitrite reductase/ring-hydroxylating ferredoxin subunit